MTLEEKESKTEDESGSNDSPTSQTSTLPILSTIISPTSSQTLATDILQTTITITTTTSGNVDVDSSIDSKLQITTQKRSFDEISQSSSSLGTSSNLNLNETEMDDIATTTVTNGDVNENEMIVESQDDLEDSKSDSILITFKVVYAKKSYDVTIDLNSTIAQLKTELFKQTNVPESMQKLCFRGNLDDSKTIQDSGIKNGVKIMMIGSKMDDIKGLDQEKPHSSKVSFKEKPSKEPLCQNKQHRKILDKGIPDFAIPAWVNGDIPLPMEPITGMVNKYGHKVRLTFKFESDEVWIGTKEHTQKLPMANVKSVISEPIDGSPQYHLMAFQVGPTEASRLWFYWVPAQYVKAIKRAIIGG